MAKQYLDENGVKQLWGKCKDKFASKANLDSYVPKSGAYMTGDLFNTNYGFYANTIGGDFRVYTNEYWQEKGLNFRAYAPCDASGQDAQEEYTLEASGRHNMASANAFFGLRDSQIIIERSLDGGKTWTAYTEYPKNHIRNIFCNNRVGFQMFAAAECSTNSMFRFTLASCPFNLDSSLAETDKLKHMVESKADLSKNRYMRICSFFTYQTTAYNKLQLTVQYAPANTTEGQEPTFTTQAIANKLTGWSGGGSFHLKNTIPFGHTSARFIRLIFRIQASDGSFDDSKITAKDANSLYEITAFSDGKYAEDPDFPECYYGTPIKVINPELNRYEFVGNYIPHENKTQSIGNSAKYLKEIYTDKLYVSNDFYYDISSLAQHGSDTIVGDCTAFMKSSNGMLQFSVSAHIRYIGTSESNVDVILPIFFNLTDDSVVRDYLKMIGSKLIDAHGKTLLETSEGSYAEFGASLAMFAYAYSNYSFLGRVRDTTTNQLYAILTRGGGTNANEAKLCIEGTAGGIKMNAGSLREIAIKANLIIPLKD